MSPLATGEPTFTRRAIPANRPTRSVALLWLSPPARRRLCAPFVVHLERKNEGTPMKDHLLLTALLLVGCLVGSSLVERSEDVASGHRRADIHPSSETRQQANPLRSLALALSSGKEEALRPFRGSPSEDDPDKDRLNPPIAGMNCYLDRIAIHVSCH